MSGSNFVFNITKGSLAYYGGLPATNDAFKALLLTTTGLQADATLADHDTVAAILAAGNTEATFTNYARQTLSNVLVSVDDANDWVTLDCDDISWVTAGGASNNTLGKLIIYYDPDTTASADANNLPISAHSYDETTSGTTLTVVIPATGFAKAA